MTPTGVCRFYIYILLEGLNWSMSDDRSWRIAPFGRHYCMQELLVFCTSISPHCMADNTSILRRLPSHVQHFPNCHRTHLLFVHNSEGFSKISSLSRYCLTKNNRGQKWYQSIALSLSFYRKKFHRFLFSRHLVFYVKLLSVIRMLWIFLIEYPYATKYF